MSVMVPFWWRYRNVPAFMSTITVTTPADRMAEEKPDHRPCDFCPSDRSYPQPSVDSPR